MGVGVSVCVGGHGMAALQSDGSVGSVGSGWIGSLFLSPPTYLPIGQVWRCLISVVHGRYLWIGGTCSLQPSFSPGEVIVSMYMYLVISSFFCPSFYTWEKVPESEQSHSCSPSLSRLCMPIHVIGWVR